MVDSTAAVVQFKMNCHQRNELIALPLFDGRKERERKRIKNGNRNNIPKPLIIDQYTL